MRSVEAGGSRTPRAAVGTIDYLTVVRAAALAGRRRSVPVRGFAHVAAGLASVTVNSQNYGKINNQQLLDQL